MAIREASLLGHYATPPADGDRRVPEACRETGAPDPPKPRLLDRVRQALWDRPLHHGDVSTTMIYTHVLNRGPAGVRSPADRMFF